MDDYSILPENYTTKVILIKTWILPAIGVALILTGIGFIFLGWMCVQIGWIGIRQ